MQKNTTPLIDYQWEGVNGAGQLASGIIPARSIAIAKAALRKQGVTIKKISKKWKPLFDRQNKKIKKKRTTKFT